MAELIVKLDDAEVQRFTLKNSAVVIGRSPDCDLVIADSKISRKHATIDKKGDNWAIADLGSRNGVSVNNELILDDVVLYHDDVVKLGNFILLFQEEGHLAKAVENIGKIRTEGGIVEGMRESQLISEIDKKLHSLSVVVEETLPKLNVSGIPGCAEAVYKLKTDYTAFRAKFTEFYDSYLTLLSLKEFALLLHTMWDEKSILESTVAAVIKFVNAERSFAMVYRPEKSELEFTACVDKTRDKAREEDFTQCRTTAEYVFESGEPVVISPGLGRSAAASFAGMKSMVCVPIKHKKEVLGILYADRKNVDIAFTVEEEHITGIVGSWLGSALIGTKILRKTGSNAMLKAESLPLLPNDYVEQGLSNKKPLSWKGARHFGACLAVYFSLDDTSNVSVKAMLRELTPWAEEFRKKVFRFQGIVLPFMGNCLIGGFGMLGAGNAVELAVQCGRSLWETYNQKSLENGQGEFFPSYKLGISSGNSLWGTMEYPEFRQHVLLGSVVDQARMVARKAPPGRIMVTEATTVMVKGTTSFKPFEKSLSFDGQETKLFLVE